MTPADPTNHNNGRLKPRILIHYAQGRYIVGVPAPAGTYALGAERRLVDAVRLVIDTDWAFSTDELAEAFGVDRADMRAIIATLAAQGRCYSWGGLWRPGVLTFRGRRGNSGGEDA